MLKKTVTYKDFNGTERTEDFYFHMTTADLMEMQVSKKEGFGDYMQKIIEADDREEIMAQFKKLLLMSVGKRSEDGRLFDKTDESFRQEFMSTNAYSQLFVELATDAEAGAAFVNGIVPDDFAEQMSKMSEKLVVRDVENVELPQENLEPSGDHTHKMELTDEDLLKMNPQQMTQMQLMRAYQLKNK